MNLRWRRLRNWLELRVLGGIIAFALALWLFIEVAEHVIKGKTHLVDDLILTALRSPADPAHPLGPHWLQEFVRDVSGLGSPAVLGLFVAATVFFLQLSRRSRTALFVAGATAGGALVSVLLKAGFGRDRPEQAGDAIAVFGSSFPSGHAMLSAVVYLTLGALLSCLTNERRQKLYLLGVAATLSGLVGVSRVYLGMHWPSDVLAGWAAGSAWALGCWLFMQLSDRDREEQE